MGKDAASRRAWVKNVAIIFLVVLLLLTFFSNTILNYSLPEVSAQYAKYGSISNAIKLNGTVKANENYSVVYDELANGASGTETTTQTRKVVSVYVKEGDTVELGAPIMALQGGASEELKAAEAELLTKQQEYELALLGDKVSSLTGDKSISDAEQAITDLKTELAKLNELYGKLLAGTDTTDIIEEQIDALEKSIKTMTKQKAEADSKIAELEGKISSANSGIEDDFSGVPLADRLRLAKEEYSDLELQYYALKDAVDATKQTLEDLQNSSGNMSSASEISQNIKTLEAQIDSLEKTVERAREDFIDELKNSLKALEQTTIIDSKKIIASDQNGEEINHGEYGKEQIFSVKIDSVDVLTSDVWKEIEMDIHRGYDWEAVENRITSTMGKTLRTAIEKAWKNQTPYESTEFISASDQIDQLINDFLSSIEASAKRHKRSIEDYDDEINEASRKLTEEKEKLKILGIDSTDEIKDYTISLEIEMAQKEYDKTKAEFDEITEKYNTAKANVESLTKQNQSAEKVAEYEKQLAAYEATSEDLENQLDAANDRLEVLNEDLADAKEGMSQKPEDVLQQIEAKKKEIEGAEASLAITKAEGDVSSTTTKYDRAAQLKAIEELKAKIEAYKNAPETTDITAPIAGRIINVNYVPGNSVTSGDTVAQIEISDKGYVCEISLASEEARKIQVGAACTITNSWWYSNLEAKVTQIRSDPQSQGKNRIIVIEVKGDVYDGQSLTFSIGDKSQSYDAVLPNSAIREDSDGKFVLTVESKKTPLGVRYTAVRYDVEIIASDDTQSAVSGLYGNEFVIINATSPVSDGQQVRLAEN